MRNTDIKRRVDRIARGTGRHEDFVNIFLFFRTHHCGRLSVRDVGDFIAHREERGRGEVTDRARDMLLSCRHWLLTENGITPSLEDIKEAVQATLRVATEKQIKDAVGLDKGQAKAALKTALSKAEDGGVLKDKERRVLNYLGRTFIWNVAYTDVSLMEDLVHVLKFHDYLDDADAIRFREARTFLALYVIATLHGTPLTMKTEAVTLRATFRQETKQLGLKAELPVANLGKPISASVFLFSTELAAAEHCDPSLLDTANWTGLPLEVSSEGKLAVIE
ncbi:hypothetical protein WMC41_13520 [Shinella yambaruensis]|uniref:hypothetical protein n=1 Tax=Shinella yambaruensis TaxID=415996 RepID=UPI003D794B72